MSIKGLNMIGPHHVCVLYVATAGLQGSLMGSDEQEVVLLIYVIVDVLQNKVMPFLQNIDACCHILCAGLQPENATVRDSLSRSLKKRTIPVHC